jgi:hypothetical protein
MNWEDWLLLGVIVVVLLGFGYIFYLGIKVGA